ncbi:hypothetical protein BSKO_12846 [Bryopsis sp. KO-2023]|nr:hypothetical protein BSKO_12846 [Bryopsis sp. KO-2023]
MMNTNRNKLATYAGAAVITGATLGAGVYLARSGRLNVSGRYPFVTFAAESRAKAKELSKQRDPPELGAPQSGLEVDPSEYPWVRRDDSVVDDIHGVQVADPYRWLEDPDNPECAAFVQAQNTLMDTIAAKCGTNEAIYKTLREALDYPKYGCPFREGDQYFYFHNSGLQNQHVLYMQKSLGGESKVLLDPNMWSEDGTVSLSGKSFSEDGKWMAYSRSSGGSDWQSIKILKVDWDVPSPKEEDDEPNLPEELKFVRYSGINWTKDNKGFFYCRFPEPKSTTELGTETDAARNQQLCYHVLETPQSEDKVVFAMPEDPSWLFDAEVSDDGRYLMLFMSPGCAPSNKVYYVDLEQIPTTNGTLDFSKFDFYKGDAKLPVVKLVDTLEGYFEYVSNDGKEFTFHSNLNAPRYKLIRTSLDKPGKPSTWKEIIPQHPKDVLDWVAPVKGDNLVVCYTRDCCNVVELRSLRSGELKAPVKVEGYGSIRSFFGRRTFSDVFFMYESFARPSTTYRLDVESNEVSVYRKTEIKGVNTDDFETKQLFVPSSDGTMVPMFVTHKKGLKLDGKNPTLLYSYGGFNHSLVPYFSPSTLCFMSGYDAVYVSGNIRGGGEYGVEWRDGGAKGNIQNTFDDFIACAENLIKLGYTSPERLAIQGGSHGGMMVAACALQRPDLFGCVLGEVGVMDLTRFHKFTVGSAWTPYYGNPDDPKEFPSLYRASPLHNIQVPLGGSKQLPAMLLTTADHDDRVCPLHTLKFLATLQYIFSTQPTSQKNPLCSRIDTQAGHGAGMPTEKVIKKKAECYAFIAAALGAKWVLD